MTIQDNITKAETAAKTFILGILTDIGVLERDAGEVAAQVESDPVLKLAADAALAAVKGVLAKQPALAGDVELVEHVATEILAALTPVVAKVPVPPTHDFPVA